MSKFPFLSAAVLGGTTVLGLVGIQNFFTALLNGNGSGLNWSGQGQQGISVPEPSFGSMALLGIGALMLVRRRKQ